MNRTRQTRSELKARRAELLVELFLEEMNAKSILRPTSSGVEYDLLVAFANRKGGTNTFAVIVEATDEPVGAQFRALRASVNILANSNVPTLLFVVNVKTNQLYYALLTTGSAGQTKRSIMSIPVEEIKPETKKGLARALAGGLPQPRGIGGPTRQLTAS